MINNSGGLGLVHLLEQIHLQEIIIIIPGNGWSLRGPYSLNYNYDKQGQGIIREVSPY